MNSEIEDISSPFISSRFRPVPFWSWNDELKECELLRQIHEMHNVGIGGFFMHARPGLRTPYMGKEWMSAVCACVREAVKLGMTAWLYDENGWPSGFGDGKVNAMGFEYQQKLLRFSRTEDFCESLSSRILAWYDEDSRLLASRDGARKVAWLEVNPFYVDLMSSLATGAFIENVHERYWRELPPDVREGLEGVFTDEAQLSTGRIEWTLFMPEEYEREYGEPLLARLPELFEETPECHRTRIRYYRLCSLLFRRNYYSRLGDWCEAHGWKLTGHNVMEEMLHGQVYTNGSVMPHYTAYSIPGVDHLDRFSPYVTTEIQCVSVAAQTGKTQILTETFGCTGWNMNRQGMKWLYQQQLVHGVNLLCMHLMGYSLRGLRKRDFPPSISFHHPMWKQLRPLNDAFSRVGRMLALGTIECDVLVIHPQSTAWADALGDNRFTGLVQRCYDGLARLSTRLDDAGIPFHYGDEILLEEMGAVDGSALCVGKMRYSLVVLPMLCNLSSKTLVLLKDFRKNGGIVLNHAENDDNPLLVDGMRAGEEDMAFLKCLETYQEDALTERLFSLVRHVRIRQLNGMPSAFHATWRRFAERREHWYYIIDTSHTSDLKAKDPLCNYQFFQGPSPDSQGADIEVSLPYRARCVRVIEQTTGEVIRELDIFTAESDTQRTRFVIHLPSCGSLLLQALDMPSESDRLPLSSGWRPEDNDNVLTIDSARFRTREQTEFSPEMNVLSIFNRLLAMPDSDVTVRYTFECDAALDFAKANLRLAVESSNDAEYSINGYSFQPMFEGWFIDRAIQCARLPVELLRVGENWVEIHFRFAQSPSIRVSLEKSKHFESEANKLHFDSELEAIYILGDFRCHVEVADVTPEPYARYLKARRVLMPSGGFLSTTSLVDGGYPFFSGTLTLKRKVNLTARQALVASTLAFSPFRADSVQAFVNGKACPPVFAAPYAVNVEGMMHEGDNEVRLQFIISPRNTLGPLHTLPAEPPGARPVSFLTEPDILGTQPRPFTEGFSLIEPGTSVTLM